MALEAGYWVTVHLVGGHSFCGEVVGQSVEPWLGICEDGVNVIHINTAHILWVRIVKTEVMHDGA